MDDALLAAFQRGERRALARLLTLAARGQGDEILARLGPIQKPSRVVAITGSGGVGKSTLIGKLIEHIRAQGQTVAVLACDPQSPLSGGALLGDRFRMPVRPEDDGVFIRSLATVAGQGAIAQHLPALVRLLEAFGFDVVLIETVGAGQGDTAARGVADVLVLLLQPETGDDLQWEKAGVLEVADIIVIHKADLPGADQAAAQVRAALDLASGSSVPVFKVSSRTMDGVGSLWSAVANVPLRQRARTDDDRALLRAMLADVEHRYARAAEDRRLRELVDGWRGGALDRRTAAAALLRLLYEDTRDND
jgi:LAO/AO transport system ATPase